MRKDRKCGRRFSKAGGWFPMLPGLLVLAMAGCGQDEPSAVDAREPLPEHVAAEVHGVQLKRSQAELETRVQLQSLRQAVPPDQLPEIERRIRHRVAQQFIARTLLAQEAERLGMVASPKEIKQAYEIIRNQLPAGQTLEDMLQQQPERADKLKEDVVRGILINKLLASRQDRGEVTQEEIDAFYQGIRRARHILVRVDSGADAEQRAAKKAQAEEIRDELVRGASSFESMAERRSDCPSAQRGGDLGTFPKGRMVPAFDQAVFNQAVGEIGPVIETEFGFHIAQVMDLEITDSGALAPEHVRREIQQTRQSRNVDAYVDQLKASAEIRVAPDFSGSTRQ